MSGYPLHFSVITLGCRVNQYESQALREAWTSAGHIETVDPCRADVVLVNSCAVTENAVADVRKVLRRYAHKRILLTGCAARLFDPATPPALSNLTVEPDKTACLPGAAAASIFALRISSFVRARAVLKIQDGCSQRCAYCVVPLARGGPRSRPVSEILDEVERLLANGIREIVLSGINLRQFVADLRPPGTLWALVREIEHRFASWRNQARFRLSSLDPAQLDDEAMEVLAAARLFCPHLHLSLQSGSPDVLAAMGRNHYQPSQVRDRLAEVARFWPTFALGADILVGFPGESDEDFARTLSLCRDIPLTAAHVFPYSPRPDTRAASLPALSDRIVSTRTRRMRRFAAERKAGFTRSLLNLPVLHVVLEEPDRGMCEFFVPCRIVPPPAALLKSIVPCRPLRVEKGVLVCSPLEEKA